MAADVCARSVTCGTTSVGSDSVESTEVGINQFFVPGVAFEIFPAIAEVPLSFLAGLAEDEADRRALIAAVSRRVIHVVAGEFDWEFTFVERRGFERVGNRGVGNNRREGFAESAGPELIRAGPGVSAVLVWNS